LPEAISRWISTLEHATMKHLAKRRILGIISTFTAAAAIAFFASLGQADDRKMIDGNFVKDANQIHLVGIQVGKLAQQRSSNETIRTFGERLVRDHSRMCEELVTLASRKGVTLTKELGSMERQLIEKLAKLSGAEFDRIFSRDMIAGHEKAVEKFEIEIRSGKDLDVKAWAEKRITTLREHLEIVRSTLTSAK
jgi:putative membrane protein